MLIEQLRRRLIFGIFVGVLVMVAIVLIADAGTLANAVEEFDWRVVPLVLFLTLLNYVLRWLKWQYYLHVLDIGPLRIRDSVLIFTSGLTMALTPGKVGELLKSYLLRIKTSAPMSKSAPIVVAERATDALGLLILAGVGLIAFRNGWQVLLASAVVITIGLVVVQHEATMLRMLNRIGQTRPLQGRVTSLEQLYASTRILLGPRPFAIGVGIGVVSWFGECVAFYLILVGLGLPQSTNLLLEATFVFTVSAWVGGISMLPGGLGASEASVAGLLILVVQDPLMTSSLAAAATLLIRFATLWFGVLLGVIALAKVAGWTGKDAGHERADPARSEREGMATAHE